MNKIAKGVVCGAAGLASVGFFSVVGEKPFISSESIEACANQIDTFDDRETMLPEECSGAMSRAFDQEFESAKFIKPSKDEFIHRITEIRDSYESGRTPRRLLVVGIGLGVAALTFNELNRNKNSGPTNQPA